MNLLEQLEKTANEAFVEKTERMSPDERIIEVINELGTAHPRYVKAALEQEGLLEHALEGGYFKDFTPGEQAAIGGTLGGLGGAAIGGALGIAAEAPIKRTLGAAGVGLAAGGAIGAGLGALRGKLEEAYPSQQHQEFYGDGAGPRYQLRSNAGSVGHEPAGMAQTASEDLMASLEKTATAGKVVKGAIDTLTGKDAIRSQKAFKAAKKMDKQVGNPKGATSDAFKTVRNKDVAKTLGAQGLAVGTSMAGYKAYENANNKNEEKAANELLMGSLEKVANEALEKGYISDVTGDAAITGALAGAGIGGTVGGFQALGKLDDVVDSTERKINNLRSAGKTVSPLKAGLIAGGDSAANSARHIFHGGKVGAGIGAVGIGGIAANHAIRNQTDALVEQTRQADTLMEQEQMHRNASESLLDSLEKVAQQEYTIREEIRDGAISGGQLGAGVGAGLGLASGAMTGALAGGPKGAALGGLAGGAVGALSGGAGLGIGGGLQGAADGVVKRIANAERGEGTSNLQHDALYGSIAGGALGATSGLTSGGGIKGALTGGAVSGVLGAGLGAVRGHRRDNQEEEEQIASESLFDSLQKVAEENFLEKKEEKSDDKKEKVEDKKEDTEDKKETPEKETEEKEEKTASEEFMSELYKEAATSILQTSIPEVMDYNDPINRITF